MALTQITADSIADAAITQQKINPSVQLGGGGPKITAVEVTDSSYTVLDDTAVALSGGYIKITGSGFATGVQVLVNNTPATSTQFVSSTTVHAQLPAKTAGSYVLYLVNSDGGVAISVTGVTYSEFPTWTTSSSLPEGKVSVPISIQLSASSATVFTVSAGSTLPAGLTLTSSGLLSGTITGITTSTVYTFSITATDAEAQDSPRIFTLTVNPATLVIGLAHFTSPFVAAYPLTTSGFGTKFADPTVTPTGSGYDIDFTVESDAVAIAHSTSPYVTAYPWTSSGFGSKYTNPSTLPDADNGEATGVSFNLSSNAIALSHSAQPFVNKVRISAYQWNSSTGFGSKYANPANSTSLIDTSINSVKFSKTGQSLAAGTGTAPYINIYQFNAASGFGTKYSNPGTQPTNAVYGIMFSSNDSYVATAHVSSPFITVYPWNTSTGFGTKYANPATLPTGTGQSLDFSPDNTVIILAHDDSPAVSAYQWSASGFGTKYANPSSFGSNYPSGLKFSPDGNTLAIATDQFGVNAPVVFPWNNTTGFGTKYTNPTTAASGSLKKVDFAT